MSMADTTSSDRPSDSRESQPVSAFATYAHGQKLRRQRLIHINSTFRPVIQIR